MTLLVTTVLLLLLTSALASGTEVALFSAPIGRVRDAVDQGRPGARSLQRIKESMARPIMAIVIVNNVANIVGSIVVGAMAADVLGSAWLGVFSGFLTLAVIVFSEIVPKTVGEQYPLRIALLTAPAVVVLANVLLPLIWLVEILVKPLARGRPITSESEIRALTVLGEEHGIIDSDESALIQRAFLLDDVTAARIMTPAPRVEYIDANATVGSQRALLVDSPHSRLPAVREGDLSKVVGVVTARELLAALTRGEVDAVVSAYAKPADFVPRSLGGNALLRHFQSTKRHLALVVDEQGIVVGAVTLEDVVEELVGEIADETDIEEQDLRALDDGALLVRTHVDIARVASALDLPLSAQGSVGEWLLESLGRIPKEGELVSIGGLVVRIAEATPRQVRWVEIRKEVGSPDPSSSP